MIRTAAVLVVAVAMSSCSAIDRNGEKGPSSSSSNSMKQPYDFELVSVKADPNHKVMGAFRFRHTRQEPIHLWGFWFEDGKGNQTDDSNTFRVRFERFKRKEEGQWMDVPVGYCGTGAEQFAIQPNRDYSLLIPLWPFAEKGTHGIVTLAGTGIELESAPFETTEIQKMAGDASRKPHPGVSE